MEVFSGWSKSAALASWCALTGCSEPLLLPSADVWTPPAIALREDGWRCGELHIHSDHSHDGEDTVAVLVDLAASLGTSPVTTLLPEYVDDRLDFLALTDHRTIDGLADPGWTSELVLLIGGQECGDPSRIGHGLAWGIDRLIVDDPDLDGVTAADVAATIADVHAQGGAFGVAHPTLGDYPWGWDTLGADSIEVWNGGWSNQSPTMTSADIEGLLARGGESSEALLHAVGLQGAGGSMQALAMYEALLSQGVHLAITGGSDRHQLRAPGFPAMYVRAESDDIAGIVAGIRARHTFVSRTPTSTQLLLRARVGGVEYGLGDQVPVPPGGAEVEVSLRVGRGLGGRALLIAGEDVEPAADMLERAELDEPVSAYDERFTVSLWAEPGQWVYPMVWDPLFAPGLTDEESARVRALAEATVGSRLEEESLLLWLARDLGGDGALDPARCGPGGWSPGQLLCLPKDTRGVTVLVPDIYDRALNVITSEDTITEWAMGAIGSAVMFVEA